MSAVTPVPAVRPDPSTAAIVRLALAFAAATNGLILSPFLVAAVMARFHLGEDLATEIVGLEILGIAVSCALLPRWIARAARGFVVAGALGAVVGQAASAVAPDLAWLGAARALTGLFEGMLFVVVASGVSRRVSTDRVWGYINLLAGALNGGLLVVIAALPAGWGARALFVLLAGVIAALAPALRGLGALAAPAPPRAAKRSRPAAPPWRPVAAIWIVTVLIYGVQTSQWAIAGFVGARAGLSPTLIGVLLSVSSLLGFAGALVPAQRASHPRRIALVWIALFAMLGALQWFFGATDGKDYFLSQLLLNSAFFVIVPFLTGRLSDLDPDGSLVARTLVITFGASGAGTALSGALLERHGSARFADLLCVALVAAAPFVRPALRATPPASPGQAVQPSR
ncbi:MFS transporter [Burkholderia sp. FERM BP-3421]|jgi:predicted MFS family arabinose efflux permease|uniref:MFS transporter n=1 Tax=Burkholderia sp. FERM BP-3421 TaxID=1494466 RepID=UPI0023629A98|nr:MFS transporter [Burkholderia sp. FERM BP-3421]WDD93628.1 MFS transporter [Burkholderia sp. FERM BP-3421]